MDKRSLKQELLLLISCFLVSRVVFKLMGVSLENSALLEYWQYLDVNSLTNNLLNSLWYQHSQPPLFNLLLGIILKCSGTQAYFSIEILLMAVSLINGILLLGIMRHITVHSRLPLVLSLVYLLSPATILYENEIFYTSFLSMLLLTAVHFMINFATQPNRLNAFGIFCTLSLVCLTKSLYHLLWLSLVAGIFIYFWKREIRQLVPAVMLSLVIVGGWYFKNQLIFSSFSASSWTGMNFSRIVFQNVQVADSQDIAFVRPFMPISYYKNYISDDYKEKYSGINDPVLISETKNGRFMNMNNAGYLQVSRKFMETSTRYAEQHPGHYLRNAFTAFIIYFTPASSYFKVKSNSNRIRYYDMIYSFNLAHLFEKEKRKKQALVVAAVPKFLAYFLVFFIVLRDMFRNGAKPMVDIFIITTILFSLIVSSLFEYGENMRFRYEMEPLFLVLVARAIMIVRKKQPLKQSKTIPA